MDASTATLAGSCLCGAFRYQINGQPLAWSLCHCTSCRKISGSTYSQVLVVPAPALALLTGKEQDLKTNRVKADSGREVPYRWCGGCGVSLWSEGDGGVMVVKAGTLDGEVEGKPVVEIFTEKRLGWVRPVEGAGQKEGM